MNRALPETAVEFAGTCERAIVEAGGVDLGRRALSAPEIRTSVVEPLLARLGAFELDVHSDEESACAGAELCRLAGHYAVPYPVVALLGRPGASGPLVAMVDEPAAGIDQWWVDHGDVGQEWAVVGSDGQVRSATVMARARNRALGPFVQRVVPGPVTGPAAAGERAWLLTLDAWRILGAAEGAHRQTVAHVGIRRQFARRLADFQGVQFHLADAEVAVRGLRQLARYTLWRLVVGDSAHSAGQRWSDALALRAVALDVAGTVFGTSQLLHGAAAFCEEYDVSVVLQAADASLRLPTDVGRTSELLALAIDEFGFAALFDDADAGSDAGVDGTISADVAASHPGR